MRRAVLLATLAVLALALGACGLRGGGIDAGAPTTEEREIEDATAVDLAAAGRLTVRTGDAPSLSVTAARNALDHLTSDVEGDTLVPGVRGWTGSLGEVHYELVLPVVEEIVLSGSGSVAADLAPGDGLTLRLDGSGNIEAADLDLVELSASLEGSGRIEVAGEAQRLEASIDGSGDIAAERLTAQDARVSVGGSGDAAVTVTGRLDAEVSGSGSIRHEGGAEVHRDVSGSGSVVPR